MAYFQQPDKSISVLSFLTIGFCFLLLIIKAHSNFYCLWIIAGWCLWHSGESCCLQYWHLYECWFLSQPLHFDPALCYCARESIITAEVPRPFNPHGRLRWRYKLLASAQPCHNCCGHLGSESDDARFFFPITFLPFLSISPVALPLK